MKLFRKIVKPQTILQKRFIINVPLGSEYVSAHMFQNAQTSVKKTQRKEPYKKQKATKIEESQICIECLEVSLKRNRDKKYTSLCRKDNSSVKRHKDRWHKGSNSSTCTIIPSSAPEIIALRKQYKDQQPTVLDERTMRQLKSSLHKRCFWRQLN